jgi:hypothetical protein
MMTAGHVLEDNAEEREYFEKANKNGRAAWRRCCRVTTGELPSWAEPARVTTQGKVTTQPQGNYPEQGNYLDEDDEPLNRF